MKNLVKASYEFYEFSFLLPRIYIISNEPDAALLEFPIGRFSNCLMPLSAKRE